MLIIISETATFVGVVDWKLFEFYNDKTMKIPIKMYDGTIMNSFPEKDIYFTIFLLVPKSLVYQIIPPAQHKLL